MGVTSEILWLEYGPRNGSNHGWLIPRVSERPTSLWLAKWGPAFDTPLRSLIPRVSERASQRPACWRLGVSPLFHTSLRSHPPLIPRVSERPTMHEVAAGPALDTPLRSHHHSLIPRVSDRATSLWVARCEPAFSHLASLSPTADSPSERGDDQLVGG